MRLTQGGSTPDTRQAAMMSAPLVASPAVLGGAEVLAGLRPQG
jgi:hypothetical protein